ncbi:YHS domain-containing (seleno)protein [Amylibacter sp. IMCC11727]|uniref:YHS domain-containing (seleno)protein n=1 Tax=Amylibacter sp. IMCC11727 TaxID=3039851 RepID=UPI00244DD49F|nr:YHS domain-containing (seleno)protein [Amylibacter sp. IMCC11727]WGI20597.1 YHS domain-containing (seleno)protein [Amylibacter sp. IMCC11727]
MNLTRRTALLAGAAALMVPAVANARAKPVYTEGKIAIDGTDAVAYFTESKPVAGSKSHSLKYKGSTWLFSSAENKAKFEADPEAYAPQYGGYCAYAMARGAVAPTVPEAWRIVDGKLYLNFSKAIQKKWQKDIPGEISKADANWPYTLDDF